ncbi:MAG: DUF3592 domain-containing protein [Terracidiphilus sp.]
MQETTPDLNIRWFFLVMKGLVLIALVAAVILARYGKSWSQRLSGIRGRDWPTVSASVDLVTVIEQTGDTGHGERPIVYLATLTYFYRNPELQTGDYCRVFSTKEEGDRWAASFKGRNVMVHVDPRDPSRSVLRAEEL